jgi:PAP2 superfamily
MLKWMRDAGMNVNRMTQVLLSLLVVAATLGLLASKVFYQSAIATAFYPYVFAAVVFIHLRIRFSWRDVRGIFLFGLLFALYDIFVLQHHNIYLISAASFLGMGSLVVMSLRAIWSEGDERSQILLALIPGALLLASNHFAGYLHLWTEKAHPKAFDLYLYSFDSSLRIPIAFLLGQAFAKWYWLQPISMIFYVGLPFALAIVYAGQAVRLGSKAIPIFAAFLFTGPIGGFCYNLLPALGPAHLFGEAFPWHPLAAEQARRLLLEPVPIAGLRNAIPSLHMGWTLMAWWYSRGLSVWERSIAFAFVAFTVLATMGTGEHYLIDLIVAFPFVLFIQALCAVCLPWSDSRRLIPFAFGLAATLGWLAILRFDVALFWLSPVLPWFCCVATVGLSEYMRRGLKDAVPGNFPAVPARTVPVNSAPTESAQLEPSHR